MKTILTIKTSKAQQKQTSKQINKRTNADKQENKQTDRQTNKYIKQTHQSKKPSSKICLRRTSHTSSLMRAVVLKFVTIKVPLDHVLSEKRKNFFH